MSSPGPRVGALTAVHRSAMVAIAIGRVNTKRAVDDIVAEIRG